MLDIYAGKSAKKALLTHGFTPHLFTHFLGASGGPKWFTLFGLDKYIFSEFFNNTNMANAAPLNIVGSSAGAFRAACFAQKNPVAAIERLAYSYAHTEYSTKPTANEISTKAVTIVDHIFGEHGAQEVINNKQLKAHFIVSQCRGLTGYESKLAQGAGLLASMALNKINRKFLALQYQRYVFKAPSSNINIVDPHNIPSHYHNLSLANIKSALLASGSIPMVMSGVKSITNLPNYTYRDGGIIDYHFDFTLEDAQTVSVNESPALTLYPHFNSMPKAGWFDKGSKRGVSQKSYDNTVLLVPSARFIQSLPYQKIPDRNDFTQMDAKTRIQYWLTVLSETERLAQALHDLLEKQDWSKVKLIEA